MSNPAINIALIAAAQKSAAQNKAIVDRLKEARAISAKSAVALDSSDKDGEAALTSLLKSGYVRTAGGGRYWLDEEAVARSQANSLRVALIVIVFLISVGASLGALLAFG